MSTDDFIIEYTPSSQRTTIRVSSSQLFVRLHATGRQFPILNISSGGVFFEIEGHDSCPIEKDDLLHIAIVRDTSPIIDDMQIQCVHVSSSGIGGAFMNMDWQTEASLDKLILEIQKQHITEKKNNQDRETTKKA